MAKIETARIIEGTRYQTKDLSFPFKLLAGLLGGGLFIGLAVLLCAWLFNLSGELVTAYTPLVHSVSTWDIRGVLSFFFVWWPISAWVSCRHKVRVRIENLQSGIEQVRFNEPHRDAWPSDLAHQLTGRVTGSEGVFVAWHREKIVVLSLEREFPSKHAPLHGKVLSYGVGTEEKEAFLTIIRTSSAYQHIEEQENKKKADLEAEQQQHRREQQQATERDLENQRLIEQRKNNILKAPTYPFTTMQVGRARTTPRVIQPTDAMVRQSRNLDMPSLAAPVHSTVVSICDLTRNGQDLATCEIPQNELPGTSPNSYIAFLYGYSYNTFDRTSQIGVYDISTGHAFFWDDRFKDILDYQAYRKKRDTALPRVEEQAEQEVKKLMNTNNDPPMMQ